MSASVVQNIKLENAGFRRHQSRAANAKIRLNRNLEILDGIAVCGGHVNEQIAQTKQCIASIESLEDTDLTKMSPEELIIFQEKIESTFDQAFNQFAFLHDWHERLLSEELDKRLGPVLNEYATSKALFEQLGRIQSARAMLLNKALEESQLPVKPDEVWQVFFNSKMNSVTVEELEETLRIRVRDALRPELDLKTALANLEELSLRTRSCIQTETAQLHEEMRNSEALRLKLESIMSTFVTNTWPMEKNASFQSNPGSAFKPTSEGLSAFHDSRGAKRPRVASEASSDEDVQDRLNTTQTSIQSVPFEGERNDSPIIVPHMQYAPIQETPIIYRGDYYVSAPVTKDFTTITNLESNARVHITSCSCIFEEGGNNISFQWMYFVYRSPYYRELTFEFSPTQVLSVVLPQRLIVVDSVCECISQIPSTVAALKSKKKSFFRALTGLGYAHKIMAKRDKKFQNQAWTATVAGVKQWLNRVRSFSPNALMIEDSDIMRLEEFIDTRVAPIIDLWEDSTICA